jgi:hypothetical protein
MPDVAVSGNRRELPSAKNCQSDSLSSACSSEGLSDIDKRARQKGQETSLRKCVNLISGPTLRSTGREWDTAQPAAMALFCSRCRRCHHSRDCMAVAPHLTAPEPSSYVPTSASRGTDTGQKVRDDIVAAHRGWLFMSLGTHDSRGAPREQQSSLSHASDMPVACKCRL